MNSATHIRFTCDTVDGPTEAILPKAAVAVWKTGDTIYLYDAHQDEQYHPREPFEYFILELIGRDVPLPQSAQSATPEDWEFGPAVNRAGEVPQGTTPEPRD